METVRQFHIFVNPEVTIVIRVFNYCDITKGTYAKVFIEKIEYRQIPIGGQNYSVAALPVAAVIVPIPGSVPGDGYWEMAIQGDVPEDHIKLAAEYLNEYLPVG